MTTLLGKNLSINIFIPSNTIPVAPYTDYTRQSLYYPDFPIVHWSFRDEKRTFVMLLVEVSVPLYTEEEETSGLAEITLRDMKLCHFRDTSIISWASRSGKTEDQQCCFSVGVLKVDLGTCAAGYLYPHSKHGLVWTCVWHSAYSASPDASLFQCTVMGIIVFTLETMLLLLR